MKKFKILIPCYNDWPSVFKLLENIDKEIFNLSGEFSVLIVNDCSSEKMPKSSSPRSSCQFQNFFGENYKVQTHRSL